MEYLESFTVPRSGHPGGGMASYSAGSKPAATKPCPFQGMKTTGFLDRTQYWRNIFHNKRLLRSEPGSKSCAPESGNCCAHRRTLESVHYEPGFHPSSWMIPVAARHPSFGGPRKWGAASFIPGDRRHSGFSGHKQAQKALL